VQGHLVLRHTDGDSAWVVGVAFRHDACLDAIEGVCQLYLVVNGTNALHVLVLGHINLSGHRGPPHVVAVLLVVKPSLGFMMRLW